MECNKDEATRAMSIAESKLQQKDFSGAKKFALKAGTLFPGLCGISHMLTTLDVYLAAENKFSGEADWYGVLGVNPSDDDSAIKKQYRKLALLLHPDKNNFVGADGAFKLISEAWRLLADKEKRMAYDQRRSRGFHQKVRTHPAGPSAPCRPHQHNVSAYTGGRSVPPDLSQQKVTSASPPRSHENAPSSQQNKTAKVSRTPNTSPFHLRSDTFWTVCHGCNIYFEYLKIYCNSTLLCRICQKPFLALATAVPVSSSKSAKPIPWVGRNSSLKNSGAQNACDTKRNIAAAQRQGADQSSRSSPRTANTSSRCPSTTAGSVSRQGNLKRSESESLASAGLEGCSKKLFRQYGGLYGINQLWTT